MILTIVLFSLSFGGWGDQNQVIRMRNYVDPKRFYKASDKVSKFMQVRDITKHHTSGFC